MLRTTLQHKDPMPIELGLTGWRSLGWKLSAPARGYVRHSPVNRGKGLVLKWLVYPLLPRNESFAVTTISGSRCWLKYRDRIALRFLLGNSFEVAELAFSRRAASNGSTAIDVGANVGLFTVELSSAVGPSGQVIAVEPLPENMQQLRSTLERNSIDNVRLENCAAGRAKGTVRLNLAADGAFTSTLSLDGRMATGNSVMVPQRTLDDIWERANSPSVSFIKIDVEGAEVEVIAGASKLIQACKPVLLLEANTEAFRQELAVLLGKYGYRLHQPEGFEPWNYIGEPAD